MNEDIRNIYCVKKPLEGPVGENPLRWYGYVGHRADQRSLDKIYDSLGAGMRIADKLQKHWINAVSNLLQRDFR